MLSLLGRVLKNHRIDSKILLAFLLLSIGAFIFLKLASEVTEGDTFAFDRVILEGLRSATDQSVPAGPAWLQVAMIDITALGGFTVLTLITVLTAGYLFVNGKSGTAIVLIVAIAGGAILSSLLKLGFARPRPDLVAHLVDVQTTSFPSGHAMNSAIAYLTLGALLARTEKNRGVRIYLLSVAIGLALAIGCSRVYLGVHWPTDVLAGWCVGSMWAAIWSLVTRALQRGHQIEQASETAPPVDYNFGPR